MRLVGKVSQLNEDRLVVEIEAGHVDYDLIGQEVVAEVGKYRAKRSMSANGYFWVLIDQIARKLGTDKESIYTLMIKDAGVSIPLLVIEDALPSLSKTFRYVEEIGRVTRNGEEMVEVMCYFGTSTYNTAEMAHIIDVTRQQAITLGCDVWTDDEIKRLFNEH